MGERYDDSVALPEPDRVGHMPLEQVLAERRSARAFSDEVLSLDDIGQLFWAGQGITDEAGHRTSPSAGALYPIELYAVTEDELIHYLPDGHELERRSDSRTLPLLSAKAFDQPFVSEAPAVLIITSVVARTQEKYGAAADDYVERESGHVAQNMLLQATALDLAAVPVGGFDADEVAHLLALPAGEEPMYLIPVGHPE